MELYPAMQSASITKFERFLFYCLFGIFFAVNTQYTSSALNLLRWILLISFFFYHGVRQGIRMTVISRSGIIWFLFMILPKFPTMIANTYMLSRAFSYILLILGFHICMNKPSPGGIREKIYFNWLANILIIGCLISFPFLFIGNGYLGGRFRGIMTNANGCALITVFAVICAIYKMKTTPHRIRYFAICVAFFVMIVLTQSRMAFVLAVIVFMTIPFLLGSNKSMSRRVSQVILILFFAMLVYFVLTQSSWGVLERLESLEAKRDIWDYAYPRIRQSPIVGHGYSYSAYQRELNPYDESWATHSSYLELLVDCGYYGFLCGAMLFITSIGTSLKNFWKDNLVLFLALAIGIGLLMGFSESFLFATGNPISVCFWFFMAILVNYRRHSGSTI